MAEKTKTKTKTKNGRKRIVIIGLGRFGSSMARTLHQQGHDVLAIDKNEPIINEMRGHVSYAVVGDATHEAVLNELGVKSYDIGIVAIGNDEKDSIMVTLLLTTLNLKHVVARAHSELHASTLERLGCHRVVRVEEEMGYRVAENLLTPDVAHVDVGKHSGVIVFKVNAGEDGKSLLTIVEARLADSDIDDGGEGKALLVQRDMGRGKKQELIHAPPPEEILHENDQVVFFGSNDELVHLSDKPA